MSIDPYYSEDMVTLYHGEALRVLSQLPDGMAQTCVTSPPYWQLRDYGEEEQLGMEDDPDEYIEKLVAIFRQVRRVLRDDGTAWLNLGDLYASGGRGGGTDIGVVGWTKGRGKTRRGWRPPPVGLKDKDIVGMPWRVAFALQADGWYLRQDIVWHKPNPLPESVVDRCTKSHEYIFLLSKKSSYYWDQKAVMEATTGMAHGRGAGVNPKARASKTGVGWGYADRGKKKPRCFKSRQNESFSSAVRRIVERRNIRSVWTIATQPYKGAHFATFPQKLITPCILAGSPKGGVVLDPFVGAGTTCLVSKEHGRQSVGIDLGQSYLAQTVDRLRQEVLAI